MFIQVNNTQNQPLSGIQVILACVGLLNPDGTLQSDDKITRAGGNVAWTWYPQVEEYELRVNTYEPVTSYTNEIRRVTRAQLEGTAQTFTLQNTGTNPNPPGPINGFGTCGEWNTAVKKIFDKHGFIGAGPDNEGYGANQAPNLRATIQEIRALYNGPHKEYVQWQYESVGNPPELRPRLFLPHSGGDEFERYADIGDWMTTFKWEHCQ